MKKYQKKKLFTDFDEIEMDQIIENYFEEYICFRTKYYKFARMPELNEQEILKLFEIFLSNFQYFSEF